MADLGTLFSEASGPRAALESPAPAAPSRIRIDPENVRNGLMQLVLTLVELIRELLERQALRRIDSGSLTPEETERLGLTFFRLSQEIERLKDQFGFTDEDLNLNLGPLGTLR
ncbi:MAG: gas vesicle protein K [Pirellulales bacterium]